MESGWCTVNGRYKEHKTTKPLDEKLTERLRDNGF